MAKGLCGGVRGGQPPERVSGETWSAEALPLPYLW